MKKSEIWKILGIEATDDKNVIKKAYREKLGTVHPEDDPEGFMLLREAYEAAMSDEGEDDLPEQDGDGEEEKRVLSPAEQALRDRLEAMYGDFSVRIDVEKWKELFEENYFVSLETGEEAERGLLEFLMDHIRVPHKVMKFIMEHFEIDSRRAELCETYPDKFIDFIIQNATYDDRLDYELFDPAGEDVDEYIEGFYRMSYAGEEGNHEQEEKELEALRRCKTQHPFLNNYLYGRRLRELYEIWQNTEEPKAPFHEMFAEELAELQTKQDSLLEQYPEQQEILRGSAVFARMRSDTELMEKRVEKLLQIEPDSVRNLMHKGKLLMMQEKYKEATDTFMEVLQKDRFHEAAYYSMQEANEAQINQLRKIIEENPEDDEKKLDLGWCLFQNDRYEEALEAIKDVEPEGKSAYGYQNLSGRLYLYTDRPEEALEHLTKWEEEIHKVDPEDMSEESITRRKRLSLSRYLQADAKRRLKKYDEARTLLESALEVNKMEGLEVDITELRIRVDYEDWKLSECFKETEELLKKDPFNQAALLFQAKCLYQFDQNREAYGVLSRLLDINPYEEEGWVVKTWILMEARQFEDALSLLDHTEELGLRTTKLLELKGKIAHRIDKFQLSYDAYTEALEVAKDDGAQSRAYAGRVAALCCMGRLDEAKTLYEEIFEVRGYDTDFLTDYGELLVRMGDLDGASRFLKERVAERSKKTRDWPSQIMRMNLCCFYGNEGYVEEAYKLFREGIQAIPDDVNAYRCMVEVLMEHGREKEAAQLMAQGLKSNPNENPSQYGLYLMALAEANHGDLSGYQDVVDKAKAFFEDRSRKIEDWDREYSRKAEFYYAIQNYEEALKMTEERLDLYRDTYYCFVDRHTALYMKGRILSKMGRHKEAADCFRKALEIFGHHKLYTDYLAQEEKLQAEEE